MYKEGWFIVYMSRDRPGVQHHKLYFHLEDKHLYTTTYLEFILELVTKFKGNHKDDLNCFSYMITWYIHIRRLLLSFIPKIYEVQKRIMN